MTRGAGRFVAAAVAIGLLAAAACSGGGRPSVEEWAPAWEDATAAIPSLASLSNPPDREACGRALGELRSLQAALFPTPDLAIDDAVREWVAIAEDAMFECPPSSKDLPNLARAYEELRRLEAEVTTGISLDAEPV